MITDALPGIRLALGVARLGELDLRGWWRAHGLDDTGKYVLSGIFPRTWRAAALELDLAAATRVHREMLGRPSALHLYSDLIPYARWAKGWLAEQKTEAGEAELLQGFGQWNVETATTTLRDWCADFKVVEGERIGKGLLLGRLQSDELVDPQKTLLVAGQLCAAYLDQDEELQVPYFDLAQ